MKIKNKKIKVILVAGLLWVGGLQAQTSFNSAGGNTNNSSGSASYSLGQVFQATASNSDGSVEEGVQHAYIIEMVNLPTQMEEVSFKIFPNPTEDYITLELKEKPSQDLKFKLINIQGEAISHGKINSNKIHINMIGLSPGNYFLNVLNTEYQQINKFKIIKK